MCSKPNTSQPRRPKPAELQSESKHSTTDSSSSWGIHGVKTCHMIVSGLCCFSMGKNGVTIMSQRVQEMCFTAAWLYPGGDRDSHKLEKPRRRGAPVGTVLTGAQLWGVGKKPGLLGIWPYKQKTMVMLYRAYWRWARSRGVSFQGGSNQPPGCHLPGVWTGYSTFPCDIENFPRGVLAQRGPEWELEQASRPLWSIPSDRLQLEATTYLFIL